MSSQDIICNSKLELTLRYVKKLSLQYKKTKSVKSCMPVKSVMFLYATFSVCTEFILEVRTYPSKKLSYPKSINACSKLGSGILVVWEKAKKG